MADIRLDLRDFHISEEVGFLLEDPLEFLPEYYDVWNKMAKNTSTLMEKGVIRERVIQMPLLDHSLLTGHRQKRLAHLQLCIISAGYMWQDGTDSPPKSLPACIAVPLWAISKDLGLPAIGGHPTFFLANWQKTDVNGELSLENLRCLYSLPGGSDSDMFFNIIARIEIDFAPGLKAIVRGVTCVSRQDEDGLILALNDIRTSFDKMVDTFSSVHRFTRPEVFYSILLPCFQGYGQKGLPDGLIFEGVGVNPVKLDGDTGAQTSINQSVDAFLGIHHNSDNLPSILNFRNYMPLDHRRFIETLEALPSTRNFVMRSSNTNLRVAYDECLKSLAAFRSYHIRSVAKYHVLPRAKSKKQGDTETRQEASGGVYPMPFLKSLRNCVLETAVAGTK